MSRDYVFTVYDTACPGLNPVPDMDKVNYVIFGREICPDSGRLHLQGYATFPRTLRIKSAQKHLGIGKSWMAIKEGTRDQARVYCMKDGNYEEHGVFEPLTQTDVFKLPLDVIKEDYPLFYCRYHRGLEKLKADKGPKWRPVKVHVLWGPTGCGKTRQVMEMDNVFKIDPPYTWWDGYTGEKILLIDDYRVGAIPRGMLLNLLDGYRLRLETKGGHTWALWTDVYVTTNFDPDDWEDAVLRRVTNVTGL